MGVPSFDEGAPSMPLSSESARLGGRAMPWPGFIATARNTGWHTEERRNAMAKGTEGRAAALATARTDLDAGGAFFIAGKRTRRSGETR